MAADRSPQVPGKARGCGVTAAAGRPCCEGLPSAQLELGAPLVPPSPAPPPTAGSTGQGPVHPPPPRTADRITGGGLPGRPGLPLARAGAPRTPHPGPLRSPAAWSRSANTPSLGGPEGGGPWKGPGSPHGVGRRAQMESRRPPAPPRFPGPALITLVFPLGGRPSSVACTAGKEVSARAISPTRRAGTPPPTGPSPHGPLFWGLCPPLGTADLWGAPAPSPQHSGTGAEGRAGNQCSPPRPPAVSSGIQTAAAREAGPPAWGADHPRPPNPPVSERQAGGCLVPCPGSHRSASRPQPPARLPDSRPGHRVLLLKPQEASPHPAWQWPEWGGPPETPVIWRIPPRAPNRPAAARAPCCTGVSPGHQRGTSNLWAGQTWRGLSTQPPGPALGAPGRAAFSQGPALAPPRGGGRRRLPGHPQALWASGQPAGEAGAPALPSCAQGPAPSRPRWGEAAHRPQPPGAAATVGPESQPPPEPSTFKRQQLQHCKIPFLIFSSRAN